MKNKILGIMLIIAIMLLVIIPIAYAAEQSVTLDLNDGSIIITPDGYTQGEGEEISYTGTYIITGTAESGTSITIQNYSNSEVTFYISFYGINMTEQICITGNSDIILDIKNYGYTSIYSNGKAAFVSNNTESTTANISIECGQLYMSSSGLWA